MCCRQQDRRDVEADDPAGRTKLTPEVAREVCERAGSKAYIAGSIASLGTEYVLGLKAVNCQNGETLSQQQVTAAAKEKVLNALGAGGDEASRRIGRVHGHRAEIRRPRSRKPPLLRSKL